MSTLFELPAEDPPTPEPEIAAPCPSCGKERHFGKREWRRMHPNNTKLALNPETGTREPVPGTGDLTEVLCYWCNQLFAAALWQRGMERRELAKAGVMTPRMQEETT